MQLFVPDIGAFAMNAADKAEFLEEKLTALRDYHVDRCSAYRTLVKDWEMYSRSSGQFIDDYPFVPVSLFKEYDLISRTEDLSVVESSSTTSKNASKIFVDKESRKRQARSANMILRDFIGSERRPYIVFDIEETVRGVKGFSARGAAILSLAHLATDFHFVMKKTPEGLELDEAALFEALESIGDQPFIAYGFTFILYQALQRLDDLRLPTAHPNTVFLHSGGWKKLTDIAVDKAAFNEVVSSPWGMDATSVIDFYGLVEQIGVPYPDCPEGVKHVPYWAEVRMRRADTLAPAEPGESGLIQLINALPLAGPSHSVLTEDLGHLERLDSCPCGRGGAAFVFEGRAPKSELRGCSDVLRS